MENKKKPLLICLTSTRNYGWVTNAFLKANSLWADYIIIVDQMSTDGTREMALANPKVILLDNEDLTYSETKRSEMAINRARQIKGDKILLYLAIDEVLPANAMETRDWRKITQSEPGTVLIFQWANLLSDKKHYFSSENKDGSPAWMARGFYDDNITPYNNYGLDMHTHCIPYPQTDVKEYFVKDFPILHFAVYNKKWNTAKQRLYQFVDFDKNKRSLIQLSRMYKKEFIPKQVSMIKEEWRYKKEKHQFDLFDEVDITDSSFFDNLIIELINKNGIKRYSKLNVWDKEFLNKFELKDPRSFWIKVIHFYLNKTQFDFDNCIFIRIVDKILKKLLI